MHYKTNLIKCISLDLDGTLLAPKNKKSANYIHPDNILAMQEFCKVEGNKIIISTGKSVQNTIKVFQYLQNHSFTPKEIPYLICLNGAEIVNTTQLSKFEYRDVFDTEIFQQILKYLRRKKFKYLIFTLDKTIRSLHFFSWLIQSILFRKKNRDSITCYRSKKFTNVQKILVLFIKPLSKRKRKELTQELESICYVSKCCNFCWEITDAKINKFYGLRIVAQKLGLNIQDFAAMGNEQNDVMSLENVGFGVGINLPEWLICNRKKIELILKDTEGDGVARAINEMKRKGLW